jgi:hypothetical protein
MVNARGGFGCPGKQQVDEGRGPPKEGTAMRFERYSALDLLADALRRADATWYGDEIREWDQLPKFQQQQWREMARVAATAVHEEISVERHRVRAG